MLIIFYCAFLFFAIRLLILWIKRKREERMDLLISQEKITTKLKLSDFWKIIEDSKRNSKDLSGQVEGLKTELRKLTNLQIVEFDNRFAALKNKAYRWDLWGAIYLLRGGCSDDSFEYFREWLIGQGKEKFEGAITNPESIKDFVKDDKWEGVRLLCSGNLQRKERKKIHTERSTS